MSPDESFWKGFFILVPGGSEAGRRDGVRSPLKVVSTQPSLLKVSDVSSTLVRDLLRKGDRNLADNEGGWPHKVSRRAADRCRKPFGSFTQRVIYKLKRWAAFGLAGPGLD